MVLGAQLMTKTTNVSTTYFQGVTVTNEKIAFLNFYSSRVNSSQIANFADSSNNTNYYII